jgi:hypothetical protein
MDDTTQQLWDCRWPDPVAIKVAADRILASRDEDDPALNRKLRVHVEADPPSEAEELTSVLLVTPWAVERIYWTPQWLSPAVIHAAPLEIDENGRVASGQGVLLETSQRTIPVLIAWEPETGHHFIETLLHSLRDYDSIEQVMAGLQDEQKVPITKKSLTQHLDKKVSRRGLFGFLD